MRYRESAPGPLLSQTGWIVHADPPPEHYDEMPGILEGFQTAAGPSDAPKYERRIERQGREGVAGESLWRTLIVYSGYHGHARRKSSQSISQHPPVHADLLNLLPTSR